jgi:hypothetical protein
LKRRQRCFASFWKAKIGSLDFYSLKKIFQIQPPQNKIPKHSQIDDAKASASARVL